MTICGIKDWCAGHEEAEGGWYTEGVFGHIWLRRGFGAPRRLSWAILKRVVWGLDTSLILVRQASIEWNKEFRAPLPIDSEVRNAEPLPNPVAFFGNRN